MTRIEDLSPAALLDAALAANSPGRILRALLARAFTPKPSAPFAHELPPHLKRDIGLPPHLPPPLRTEIQR